jgi:serine phosphatase RsbU (regulator of sigma subunit)
VESDSAFSDLRFATYLGSPANLADMETTDVAPSRLPLSGTIDRETIPFGDTTLTLVTAPIGHLGGTLSAEFPWISLGVGAVLTIAAAVIAGNLARRRAAAETDAQTIRALYDRLDNLYGEQRSISETLQRALLPQINPPIPNLTIASRYVAGARGVEIGGDWYSIIAIDDTHFAFVVGDVSGRGVEAAAIMARIRFTLRAYLLEGHPPDVVLGMCSRQIDINADGHIVTALVGIADRTTREVTLASAGHLSPLVVSGLDAQFASTTVGPPLGVAASSYTSSTFVMDPESTFIAFSDGLVERRDEDLDVGLTRLAAVASAPQLSLEDLLTRVLSTMTGDGAEDDTAILAFRWV